MIRLVLDVARFLVRLRSASLLVDPAHSVSASPDEPDNRFLECAEAAGADFLVTGNSAISPDAGKPPR
jgi:predicted nucleic acid-binding protein